MLVFSLPTAWPETGSRENIASLNAEALTLSLGEAVLMALDHNHEIKMERLSQDIQATYETEERAAFDPTLGGEYSHQRTRSNRLARTGSGTESSLQEITKGNLSMDQSFPTGTSFTLDENYTKTESSLYANPLTSTRLGLTFTQSLLQGGSRRANLAGLEQARLDSQITDYEFRGFAESLVAEVEQTYWDLMLSERRIKIFEESMNLAEQQLSDTQARIEIGQLPEVELAASQAELASRREDLINARGDLALQRLKLLQLINPPGVNLGHQEIFLTEPPVIPDVTGDSVDIHLEVAQRMRPELNQTRLEIDRGQLEVIKTKNGLLPFLDVFITMGKTGYAESFPDSWKDLDEDSYDVLTGVQFSYPILNRAANAKARRAHFGLQQVQEALRNLEQLVEVDVRSAYIEINRTREQMAATKATRQFRDEALGAEMEKFRVGRSTSFLVAQAQRDLVQSQIDAIEATANHIKAWIELFRQEGSLLERRGIDAPGREPVPSEDVSY